VGRFRDVGSPYLAVNQESLTVGGSSPSLPTTSCSLVKIQPDRCGSLLGKQMRALCPDRFESYALRHSVRS